MAKFPVALAEVAGQLLEAHPGMDPAHALCVALDGARQVAEHNPRAAAAVAAWDAAHGVDLANDDASYIDLAAINKHHVPGTAYHWWHNYRPRDVATALMWGKKHHAAKLHKAGAGHFTAEPSWWVKQNPHLKHTIDAEPSMGKLSIHRPDFGPSHEVGKAKKSGKHMITAPAGSLPVGKTVHAKLPGGETGQVTVVAVGKEFPKLDKASGEKKPHAYHYTELQKVTSRPDQPNPKGVTHSAELPPSVTAANDQKLASSAEHKAARVEAAKAAAAADKIGQAKSTAGAPAKEGAAGKASPDKVKVSAPEHVAPKEPAKLAGTEKPFTAPTTHGTMAAAEKAAHAKASETGKPQHVALVGLSKYAVTEKAPASKHVTVHPDGTSTKHDPTAPKPAAPTGPRLGPEKPPAPTSDIRSAVAAAKAKKSGVNVWAYEDGTTSLGAPKASKLGEPHVIVTAGGNTVPMAGTGKYEGKPAPKLPAERPKSAAKTSFTPAPAYKPTGDVAAAKKVTAQNIGADGPALDPAAKPAPKAPAGMVDTTGWKKVGEQKGSNPGGTYQAPDGSLHYVKQSKSADHARNEALAASLYAAAGVDHADLKLADVGDGKIGTAAPLLPGAKSDLKAKVAGDAAYRAKVQEGFAADAWLANWDVVGLGHDNIVTDGTGKPVRIDPGGALLFRAQGGKKGGEFTDSATEWDSMRSGKYPQANSVFGGMSDAQLKASAQKVVDVSPAQIDQMVKAAGFDPTKTQLLATRLKARRADIAKRAGIPLPEEKGAAPAAPKAAAKPAAPQVGNLSEGTGLSERVSKLVPGISPSTSYIKNAQANAATLDKPVYIGLNPAGTPTTTSTKPAGKHLVVSPNGLITAGSKGKAGSKAKPAAVYPDSTDTFEKTKQAALAGKTISAAKAHGVGQQQAAAIQKAIKTGKPHFQGLNGGPITKTAPETGAFAQFNPDGTVQKHAAGSYVTLPESQVHSLLAKHVGPKGSTATAPKNDAPAPMKPGVPANGGLAAPSKTYVKDGKGNTLNALTKSKMAEKAEMYGQPVHFTPSSTSDTGWSNALATPPSGSHITVAEDGSVTHHPMGAGSTGHTSAPLANKPTAGEFTGPKQGPALPPTPGAAPKASKKAASQGHVTLEGTAGHAASTKGSLPTYTGPGKHSGPKSNPGKAAPEGTPYVNPDAAKVEAPPEPAAAKIKGADPVSQGLVDSAATAKTIPVKNDGQYLSQKVASAMQKSVAKQKSHYVTHSDATPATGKVTATKPKGVDHIEVKPDGTQHAVKADGTSTQMDPATVAKHVGPQLAKYQPNTYSSTLASATKSFQSEAMKIWDQDQGFGKGTPPPLKFLSDSEYTAHYKATLGTPTGGQLSSLGSYTGGGYSDLNAQLRSGGELTPSQKTMVNHLDEMIASHELPGDLRLTRFIGDSHFPSSPPPLEPGSMFHDGGFVSTSHNDVFSGYPIRMDILAPKGLNALSVNGAGGGSHPGEREVILARNTQFVVHSDTIKDGKRWLVLTAVPPAAAPAIPGVGTQLLG